MITFIVFLIFIVILVGILLILNLLLAVHLPYGEKVDAYECGFLTVGEQTRNPFDIGFYLVGVLFMVFDVELILFTPIVLSLKNVELFGFIIAILFFLILTFGFIYEIGKGALNMTKVLSINK